MISWVKFVWEFATKFDKAILLLLVFVTALSFGLTHWGTGFVNFCFLLFISMSIGNRAVMRLQQKRIDELETALLMKAVFADAEHPPAVKKAIDAAIESINKGGTK